METEGPMQQQIRFVKSFDGTRIAYAAFGDGPPLVRVARWGGGLELIWHHEEAGAFYRKLSEGRRLVVLERRGQGASQRDVEDLSMTAHVGDVRALVDHLGLDGFAMFGDGDAAAVCVAFAATYPERVSRLVLWGGYAKGKSVYQEGQAGPEKGPLETLILSPHPEALPAVDRLIALRFVPSGPVELQRSLASLWVSMGLREVVLKYFAFAQQIDVTDQLTQITCPALVLHRRGDQTGHTLELSREIASLIPNARLVVVEGDIGLPEYDHEQLIKVVNEFLAEGEGSLADARPAEPSAFRTILFTDMEGSTALTERLGDAKAQELRRAHDAIVRDALKAKGGSETKHTGDGIMASFPSASRAIECAVAVQRAVAGHGETPLRVRIGLNAGEPVAEEKDLFGTAVNLAKRICDRAEPGQILVSDDVQQLAAGKGFTFADKGEATLKGFEKPVRLYEVRWQESQ
jgi:class 3 adenylate cyclase/pimeloyl-ACP methyl ester carboxylesterase